MYQPKSFGVLFGKCYNSHVRQISHQFTIIPCELQNDAHKMPKYRHFGTGSDTMQQVHGAGVKSNREIQRAEDVYGRDKSGA